MKINNKINKPLLAWALLAVFIVVTITAGAWVFTTPPNGLTNQTGMWFGNNSLDGKNITGDMFKAMGEFGTVIGSYTDSYSCDGSFCIYKPWYDSSKTYAKNMSNGTIISGTDDDVLLNGIIADLSRGGKIVFKNGTYTFSGSIDPIVNVSDRIEIYGEVEGSYDYPGVTFNIASNNDGFRLWHDVKMSNIRFVNTVAGYTYSKTIINISADDYHLVSKMAPRLSYITGYGGANHKRGTFIKLQPGANDGALQGASLDHITIWKFQRGIELYNPLTTSFVNANNFYDIKCLGTAECIVFTGATVAQPGVNANNFFGLQDQWMVDSTNATVILTGNRNNFYGITSWDFANNYSVRLMPGAVNNTFFGGLVDGGILDGTSGLANSFINTYNASGYDFGNRATAPGGKNVGDKFFNTSVLSMQQCWYKGTVLNWRNATNATTGCST